MQDLFVMFQLIYTSLNCLYKIRQDWKNVRSMKEAKRLVYSLINMVVDAFTSISTMLATLIAYQAFHEAFEPIYKYFFVGCCIYVALRSLYDNGIFDCMIKYVFRIKVIFGKCINLINLKINGVIKQVLKFLNNIQKFLSIVSLRLKEGD